MNITLATIATTPLDVRGNVEKIINCLGKSGKITCFPELSITGYGCEDAFFHPKLMDEVQSQIMRLVELSAHRLFIVGAPFSYHGGLFNAMYWICNQKIIGITCKKHLANDGIHYESRWFKPWTHGVAFINDFNGYQPYNIPVGDFIVSINGTRIGMDICEDGWVSNSPSRLQSLYGVDVVLNPSASHFSRGKDTVRLCLVQDASRSLGCAYLYTNLIGNEAGRVVYDGHRIAAENGSIIYSSSISEDLYGTFDCNVSHIPLNVRKIRAKQHASSSRRVSCDNDMHVIDVLLLDIHQDQFLKNNEIVTNKIGKFEDGDLWLMYLALIRSLVDVSVKTHSLGFTVSLSGGCDSALVAAACYDAIECMSSFGMKAQLYTAYQSASCSGEKTKKLASDLAKVLNAHHSEWVVPDLEYKAIIEKALGRTLDFDKDDATCQNIQARARVTGIWGISNATNTLLLTTSNRTEASVGYATMDGDTAGSYAPIAGISKNQVRQLLHLLSLNPRYGIEIKDIVTTPSSPELRPDEQTSEGDLAPFPVLETIERCFVVDKISGLKDLVSAVAEKHHEFPISSIEKWVNKFLTLWHRNQWKRERYAPAFHLDDENLDPRSWCRFPILSGKSLF